MKAILIFCFGFAMVSPWAWGDELESFVSEAKAKHGEFGERAAKFLIKGMPKGDREALTKDFLMTNIDWAIKARNEFSWAKIIPEDVFFNDVLPYASLDETREDWRTSFYPMCAEIVKDAKSGSEAAHLLNQKLFKKINVHYGRKRKAPNQSPAESIEQSKATCTGLSIILVDACRSVGVPARVVGTASWVKKKGNHTWVEIYDGGEWYFAGADEASKKGLNDGWFMKDAAHAKAEMWQHAVWASSWKKADGFFPMVWNIRNTEIAAVNVTARYTTNKTENSEVVFVRVWDKKGGKRVVATLNESLKTKAGTADLNDMAEIAVKAGEVLKVTLGDMTRQAIVADSVVAGATIDLYWNELK